MTATRWWLSSNPDLYQPTEQDWADLNEMVPARTEEDDPFTCPRCHGDYPQGNPQDHFCPEASDA